VQNLVDWFVIVLRWSHIVAILGWVGASLYFMWLDSKLRQPSPARDNVLGEAWMGHGGGFYIVEKRHISPGQAPSPVWWFRNEAMVTWVTGFLLLVFVYYWSGGTDLVEPGAPLSPAAAIAFAIAMLVVCWVVYDLLWASRFAADHWVAASAISAVLLLAVVVVFCELFTGRAAYIHIGSVMGTCMVGNVWMRIIPSQVEAVAATSAGRERDMVKALRARRRAQHNTYLTLPVIFSMIATHAPATYGHPRNWLIMALLIAAGMAARYMMILWDRRTPARGWLAPALAVAVALLVIPWLTAAPGALAGASLAKADAVSIHVARGIVELRCVSCHSAKPPDTTFTTAAGGVRLDRPEDLARHATRIHVTTVATRVMPPGNVSRMTDEERALLGRWLATGVRTTH
jgi:uncharacterized membrane protein